MKKLISLLLILLLAIAVAGCGTTEQGEKEPTSEENKTDGVTNGAGEESEDSEEVVEPTEEDVKFTKLLVEQDYETLTKETITLATPSQKNFYYLVSAFKKQEEIISKSYVDETTNEMNYTDIISDNKVILNYFKRVTFVPEEIK